MLFLATVCLLISAALSAPANGGWERGRQPNIVLLLADDLGYNDVGFNGSPDIQTPNLDALAAEGVILKNYYVQPICSPSRSQLLSGVHETVSGLCHGVIRSSQRLGLPLNLPTLPQKLRDVGYATHLIGKWHLGHHETSFLPTHRGFDTFLGCVNGLTEQYTHRPFERFFNSTGALNKFIGHDMFEGDAPLYGLEGQHTTDIYTNRFEKLLKDHMEATPHKPFFIDVAFTAPHSPLQAPDRFVAQYSNVQDINRRLFSAMVSHLDEAVGNMTRAIKSYGGLWQNTIIIFSTDNGGPVNFGADNFPLRGGKATFFEGGIKGASFITSPLIHQNFRGKTNNAWLHISDWYPTLISLAGGDVSGQRLNGFNVWPSINGIFPSPRVEQLINIDNSPAAGLWGAERPGSPFDVRVMGAIRVGQWKLITGNPGTTPHWYNTPNSIPNVTILPRVGGLEFVSGLGEAEQPGYIVRTSTDSSTKNVWLFDVVNDPYEYNDLSETYPFIVDFLLTRLAYYKQFIAAPGVCAYPRMDMLANPDLRGGAFGPWASNNLPPPQY